MADNYFPLSHNRSLGQVSSCISDIKSSCPPTVEKDRLLGVDDVLNLVCIEDTHSEYA